MKLFQFVIFSAALIFFLGCSDKTNEVTAAVDSSEQNEVIASHKAKLGVEGMVCEMGCAASIKKGLNNTNGIASVNVEFEEERDQNEVIVEFDEQIISIDEIVKTIQALNDGQFSAIEIENKAVQPKVSKISIQESSSSSKQKSQQEVQDKYFQFPNLMDLLKGLVY